MANTLTGLIPTIYRGLNTVSRELVGFIPSVSRDTSESMASLNQIIRVPQGAVGGIGDVTPASYAPDAGTQANTFIDMAVTKSKFVKVHWTGEEQLATGKEGVYNALLADQFAEAMRKLANAIEADLGATYVGTKYHYGTAGTAPFASDIKATAQLRKILTDNGAPLTNMKMVLNTSAGANLRQNTHLSHANEAGSDATLRQGILLDLNGFAIRESAQVATHVKGTTDGTAKLTTAGAKGDTTIAVETFAAGAYKVGDILTFSAYTGKHIVTSVDVTGKELGIYPALAGIVATTETISTADYNANMVFDGNAIKLLVRAPAVPDGGDMAEDRTVVVDPVSGLPFQISLYRQYRQVFFEVAIAWGVKMIKPEHCAIFLG